MRKVLMGLTMEIFDHDVREGSSAILKKVNDTLRADATSRAG